MMKSIFSSFITIFAIVFVFLGCKDHQKTTTLEDSSDLVSSDTSLILDTYQLLRDSIFINATFSECGEWGGHEEKIIVSVNRETRELFADYKVYPFNCDSLPYYLGNQLLKPIINKRIRLDNRKKKSIMEYVLRLSQSKITESFPGHAGNIFSVAKSDSTLIISVYDNKEFDIKSYKQLIADLF